MVACMDRGEGGGTEEVAHYKCIDAYITGCKGYLYERLAVFKLEMSIMVLFTNLQQT